MRRHIAHMLACYMLSLVHLSVRHTDGLLKNSRS